MDIREETEVLSEYGQQVPIVRQRGLPGKPNLGDRGARRKRNGTRTHLTRGGLRQFSPSIFRRVVAIGSDREFVGCLRRWRGQRWRSSWRRSARHELRHPRVGRRDGSESQWLSHLCRHYLGNVRYVPGRGTGHYLYRDGIGQRDVLFCGDGLRYVDERECILDRNIQELSLMGWPGACQAAVDWKTPNLQPGANR